MAGRLDGTALRVPVPVGSITDFTAVLGDTPDVAAVNVAFAAAASSPRLGPVMVYSEAPLVSSDIVGSPASCTFDAPLTMVQPLDDQRVLVKVFGLVRQRVGLRQPAGRSGPGGRGRVMMSTGCPGVSR